jgi:hypothetical protein
MRRIAADLEARGVARKVDVIDSARVPIVKLWEARSGIQIDISFDARSAVVSRALIGHFLARFPALRPLLLVAKYFVAQRGLNDTYSGGVGSFLLVLMVVHVLQLTQQQQQPSGAGAGAGADAAEAAPRQHDKKRRRRDQEGAGAGADDDSAAAAASADGAGVSVSASAGNSRNLGVLLVSFLEHYGCNLNLAETGFSVRGAGGGFFSKRRRGWSNPQRPDLLSVENPCEPGTDVGRNSWAFDKVRRAMRFAHGSLARAVRAWAGEGIGGAAGFGGGGGGGGGSRSRPASLLAAVIRVDSLLADREADMGRHSFAEAPAPALAPAAPAAAPAEAEAEAEAGADDVAPGTEALAPGAKRARGAEADAAEGEAAGAASGAGASPAAAGAARVMRHPRLLADLATRRARGVDQASTPQGWI